MHMQDFVSLPDDQVDQVGFFLVFSPDEIRGGAYGSFTINPVTLR